MFQIACYNIKGMFYYDDIYVGIYIYVDMDTGLGSYSDQSFIELKTENIFFLRVSNIKCPLYSCDAHSQSDSLRQTRVELPSLAAAKPIKIL